MNEAIAKYIEAIKADYRRWSKPSKSVSQAVIDRAIVEFEAGLEVVVGKAYLKVVTNTGSSRSVHSFIVAEDGPKFKKGDILKAASWSAPAKNAARGNIFGEYQTQWTGAVYLR